MILESTKRAVSSPSSGRENNCARPLVYLAPDGVFQALPVTQQPVSSYLERRCASARPFKFKGHLFTLTSRMSGGGLFSVALSSDHDLFIRPPLRLWRVAKD